MFANTKQMRAVIKMAMTNVGTFAWMTHTDMDRSTVAGRPKNSPIRYIGFNVADDKSGLVVKEAQKICAALGFTNTVRQGKKSYWMVRTTATLDK